jgi:hypothetical protein
MALAATERTALCIAELSERAAAAPWRQSVVTEWQRAADRLGAQLHPATLRLVWPRPSARVVASIRFSNGAPITLVTVDFGEVELEPSADSLAAALVRRARERGCARVPNSALQMAKLRTEELGGTVSISGGSAQIQRSGIVGSGDALAELLEATADLAEELALQIRVERGPYRSGHG